MTLAEHIEAAAGVQIYTPWGDMTAPLPVVGRIAQLPGGLPPYSVATRRVAPTQAANDSLPRVIALTGLAGAGKSTVAGMLADYGYTLVKFAAPLKAMLRALGLDDRQIEGDLKEVPIWRFNGRTARYAMQTLGLEWGRKCMGENFWVDQWLAAIGDNPHVVVDDCRFPNEAAAVRQLGGVVWSIEGRGGIAGNHASEAGVGSAPDRVIVNAGPVTELRAAVSYALGYVN